MYVTNESGIAATANPNLTGVVSMSVQENSEYQTSIIQAFWTPAQAREFAQQLLDAAQRVEGELVWCENEGHPHKPHILVSACTYPHFSGRYGDQGIDRSVEDEGLAQWELDLLNSTRDEPPF